MNLMKRFLLSGLVLSIFIILTGCETMIENSIINNAYRAFDTYSGIRVDYSLGYGPGEYLVRYSSTVYMLNHPNIQAGYLRNQELSIYIYNHNEKSYRVFPHEDDYYYEEFPFDMHNFWMINQTILSKNDIGDTFTTLDNIRTYSVSIEATKVLEDYPTLAYMFAQFENKVDEKELPDLSDVSIDFLINIDIDSHTIVSMEADIADFLMAKYNNKEKNQVYNFPSYMTVNLIYEDVDIPDLVWGNMIADDASAYVDAPHHTLLIGENNITNIQYLYDSDLFVLTIDEHSIFKITLTGVIEPNIIVKKSSGEYIEIGRTGSLFLDAGTYYFYVTSTQLGEVSFMVK